MTDDTANDQQPAGPPLGLSLHDGLGPLPETEYGLCYFDEGGCHPAYEGDGFTANQMRAYANAAVAAERERCAAIADTMRLEGAIPDTTEAAQDWCAEFIAGEIRGWPEEGPNDRVKPGAVAPRLEQRG